MRKSGNILLAGTHPEKPQLNSDQRYWSLGHRFEDLRHNA